MTVNVQLCSVCIVHTKSVTHTPLCTIALHVCVAQHTHTLTRAGGSLRLVEALPACATPDERKAKVAAATKWVKATPLAGKPLVKSSVQLMTDDAVRALQHALPVVVSSPRCACVCVHARACVCS